MAQFDKTDHKYLKNNNTVYEVVMLADQYGNNIGPANPSGVAVDAFGRARVSTPLTLFDSSHRFSDNGLWAESTSGTASSTFNTNGGYVDLSIGSASGDEIIRETYKVFSYQPGKSLQILTTFRLEEAKTNLRQRVGYFGAQNGIYLQLNDSTTSFVERSYVTGSVVETTVNQADWNVDKMDGTGPSLITLDITKAQILWTDIEWLGLGTVRMGFVIDGKFIHCHSFHHANLVAGTYITTASLPLRQEMTNTGNTSGTSDAIQVCSSVISEGGYELRGEQKAVEIDIETPRDLASAGTYYPIVSIRLKSTRRDAIAIITALSIMGVGNNPFFNWKIIADGTTTGGTWVSAGSDSSIEYNISGTSFTNPTPTRTLASGYIASTTQSTSSIDILKEALFKFQLEADRLAGTSKELTLVVATDTDGADVYASMDWEEISR
jgi:hypothetical protein